MSVYSMTGYATAHRGADGMPEGLPGLGVEIRSVNSRFLDLVLKLPEELRGAEPALRDMLGARLRRGKVEVRVWLEGRTDAGPRAPGVAELQRLSTLQDLVRDWLPQATPFSVAEVLQLTGRQGTDPGSLQAPLLHLAGAALESLLDARRREGRRLADTLLDRAAQLRKLASDAQPLIPRLVEQQRQRFLERWKEALGADGQGAIPGEAARDRALSEATAFAIRIDVAEELTRLDAHLGEIERLLDRGAEVGKRLDFLIQELHREANTLGSKSSSLELTRISVDMKVLIEQMREQVQNLE
ncbi:MAG: YicC family protein [Hydrogenophaga sp.]|nr:YicC family protein [Hydrogenophaga sp.]